MLVNNEVEYVDGRQIPEDNLVWQEVRYVTPMRLLSEFFSVNSEVAINLVIRFNLEQDVKRLFECILPNDAALNNNPTRIKPYFFDVPKIYYNSYVYTPKQLFIHNFVMKKIKGKRTGVQPFYHEKNSIIKENSFNTLLTFENTGTQFEWIIISLVPVLSKEHRNTYATYNRKMANRLIRKITI